MCDVCVCDVCVCVFVCSPKQMEQERLQRAAAADVPFKPMVQFLKTKTNLEHTVSVSYKHTRIEAYKETPLLGHANAFTRALTWKKQTNLLGHSLQKRFASSNVCVREGERESE